MELWGTEAEIACWNVLRNDMSNSGLSDTDISELVPEEDLSAQLRKEHIKKLNSLSLSE